MKIQDSDFIFNVCSGENQTIHKHRESELIYLLNGTLELSLSENNYHMYPSDLILINSRQPHTISSSAQSLFCQIYFSDNLLKQYVHLNHLYFVCNTTASVYQDYTELYNLLDRMLQYFMKCPNQPSLMLKSSFYALFDALCRNFLMQTPASEHTKTSDRISEIMDYVEEYYNQPITLTELAEHLHLSYHYLSRLFKVEFGMTFTAYLNTVRLEHVAEELINTEKSITRLSEDHGFSSVSYLNKMFKNHFHTTPVLYRADHKSNTKDIGSMDMDSLKNIQKIIQNHLMNSNIRASANSIPEQVSVSLNAGQRTLNPVRHLDVIVIGPAKELLTANMQNQIIFCSKTLGFRYVYFWDLFFDITPEPKTDTVNFDSLDNILEFLAENGLYPLFDLGKRSSAFMRSTTDLLYKNLPTHLQTTDLSYLYILEQFLKHSILIYDQDFLSKWKFHLYLNDHPEETNSIDDIYIDYWNSFLKIKKLIKGYLPQCEVGGADLKVNDFDWDQRFSEWFDQDESLDFITFGSYPYLPISREAKGNEFNKYSKDPSFHANQLKYLRAKIEKVDPSIPLYLLQWGSTYTSRNFFNDSLYEGTYILKHVLEMKDMISFLGCDLFTDLIPSYVDSSSLLFGGNGLLSKHGITKPSYYAYQFLNSLGKYLLAEGDEYLCTMADSKNYYFICFNYKFIDYSTFHSEENDISISEVLYAASDSKKKKIVFTINNAEAGAYSITRNFINSTYGSVLDEWNRLDCTKNMRFSDIQYLKQICIPHVQISKLYTINNCIHFSVDLEPAEFSFIHVQKIYEK